MPDQIKPTHNEVQIFMAIKACSPDATTKIVTKFLASKGTEMPRASIYNAIRGLKKKGYAKSVRASNGEKAFAVIHSRIDDVKSHVDAIKALIEAAQMATQYFGPLSKLLLPLMR